MNTNISPLNSQILFSLLSMSIALPMLSATAAVAGVPPSVALDDSPDVCEADCKAPDDWDDPYKALYNECCYITFASMSGANDIVIDQDTPGYGAVNQWRIGKDTKDKRADSVNPGTSAIAMIGLLYGYNRLVVQDKSSTDLDCRVKTTLRSFFHNWIRNSDNQIVDNNGRVGFPNDKPWATEYDIEGNLVNKNTEANAGVTSELIMAMAHYVEHSPNNDGADHQSESYDLAYKMAQYVAHNSNLGSWTHDRSYAVAAFTAFANWADAMGDAEIASSYRNKADDIVYLLEKAKDHGTTSPSWYNFFNYLDSGGKGVYLNADQTGFAPYEFNTRDACEPFADRVGESWDYGRYGGHPFQGGQLAAQHNRLILGYQTRSGIGPGHEAVYRDTS